MLKQAVVERAVVERAAFWSGRHSGAGGSWRERIVERRSWNGGRGAGGREAGPVGLAFLEQAPWSGHRAGRRLS